MKLLQTKGDTLTFAYQPDEATQFGRRPKVDDLRIQKNLAFVSDKQGRILWQGARRNIPKALMKQIKTEAELPPATYLPSFVECHTHLIFAGDRQNEFEMRNQGATYQQIAESGGGIASTVKHTRQASTRQLVELAKKRVERFAKQGVGVIEAKTGYGLSWAEEKKLLKALLELKGSVAVEIIPTYLGPHSKSPEFSTIDEYMEDILSNQIPGIAKLKIPRADIFIENGYFTVEQGQKYIKALKANGIAFSIHADQLTSTGSSSLGAQLGAQSVDHCVCSTDQDIENLAKSSTVAVLLPTADFYIKIPYPRARKMLDAGVFVALATDFNPGSSPTQDLSFVGVLARLEMKMSLAEVLFGYTLNAARAVGRQDDFGSLQVGKYLNLACLASDWTNLFYQVGDHPVMETWIKGRKVKFP